LRTLDGSARLANAGGEGPDYGALDTRVTWASGDLGVRTVAVEVLADSTADPGESFLVEILEPYNGAVIAGATRATVAIGEVAPQPPVITVPPAAAAVDEGAILRLQVVANGAELTYRWRRNGVDLADDAVFTQTDGAELRIAGIRPGDAGLYDCRVANRAGAVTSIAATVAVDARPSVVITMPTVARIILPDPDDHLMVAAAGSDPEGAVLAHAWTLVEGPAGGAAVVADPATAATGVRCTVDDGGQTAAAEVVVHAGATWAEGVAGPLRTTGSGVPVGGSAEIGPGSATVSSSWTESPSSLNGWFRHARIGGDFSVTVRVAATGQVPQQWAQYGILATPDGSLPATAAFAFMGTYAGQGPVAQIRPFTGGAVISQRVGSGSWFRLTRRGDLFTGFRSADGATWTQQMEGVVVPMGQAVRVGLIVNAHNNGGSISTADAARRMTVVWDQLTGLPDVGAAPEIGLAGTRTVAAGVRFTASGTVNDDGGMPTVLWQRIGGPGTAAISTPSATSTRVLLAQAGVHVLRLTADDGTARVYRDQTVTAGFPPVITTTALPVVRIGDPVDIALTADHLPTAWSATGLPTGLAIAATSGRITGTPAAVGSFTVTATAANSVGSQGRSWILTVEDLPDLPPVVDRVAPADVRTGATVAIEGSGFGFGATVRIGGLDAASAWISTGRMDAVVPAGLAGPVTVVVANGSATAAWADRLRIDDVPPPRPAAPVVSGNASPAPVLSGTAAQAVTVAVLIDGSERIRLALNATGAWSWAPSLPIGSALASVRAFDAAGNVSPVSTAATVSVTAPPAPPTAGGGGGGGGGCGLGSGLGLLLAGLFLAHRRRSAASRLRDRG
jgi:hypothetical protein